MAADGTVVLVAIPTDPFARVKSDTLRFEALVAA